MQIGPLVNRNSPEERLLRSCRASSTEAGSILGSCFADAVLGVGLAAAFVALLLTPFPSLAIHYDSGTKLFSEDGMLYDGFASNVAISGEFVLVGAPGYGYPTKSNAGAAFVFEHRPQGGFVEHALIPADSASFDSFGNAIAISGNRAVVGAPYDDDRGANSGSAYVYFYDGESWVLDEKLVASDGVAYDEFGTAVAISGDVIVVGAPVNDFSGDDDPGAIYVFRHDGADWVEEDKTSASDGAAQDDFGSIVALSGDTALVGLPDYDATSDLGKVYVYRYDGAESWGEEDTLSMPPEDNAVPFGASFGEIIAVSGDTLLVGAYRGNDGEGNRVGVVYVYRSNGLGSWDEEARLSPTTPSPAYNYLSHFGRSVALSGDTAVMGAKGGALSSHLGAAHVFWYDGASWVEQDTITTNDPSAGDRFGESVGISGSSVVVGDVESDGRAENSGAVYLFETIPDAGFTASDGDQYDEFGRCVGISGDTVLIGAPGDEEGGVDSGSAYLFWYDGANWFDEDKLSGGPEEVFGAAVALEGHTAVVGAPGRESSPGAVYVFEFAGEAWSQDIRLTPTGSAAEDAFGAAVAISGARLVVGAPATENNAANGAAYVFVDDGGGWAQQAKLTAADGGPDDEFGSSVSISGDTIVVGAQYDDEAGIDAGAAYVFTYSDSSWDAGVKINAADVEADDEFGCSVANSSDTIVVGAKRDGDNGDDAGAAYVFKHDGEGWKEQAKLKASDGAATDRFGISVAISSDDTIAVGAEWDDQRGSAYAFWYDGRHWVEEPKLLAPVRGTDYFGASIAISGDVVLVGAPYANGDGDDNGAAYASTVNFVNVPEPALSGLSLAALSTLALVARRRTVLRRGGRP